MRIYAVADIHGQAQRLAVVQQMVAQLRPDLLVAAGDVIQRRRPEATLNALAQLDLPVLLVRGNGDGPRLASAASAWPTLAVLHRGAWGHGGARFAGIGGTVLLPFGSRIAWREKRLLAALAPMVERDTILIAHPPPHGVCDRVAQRFRSGSHGLRQLILDRQPEALICGHVHEDAGIAQLGATLVVNASMGQGGAGALVTLTAGKVEARMLTAPGPAATLL